jgi:hypothetical protein
VWKVWKPNESQASLGIQPSAEYPKGEWHQSKYLAAKVSEGSQGVRSSPGKMAKKVQIGQFWCITQHSATVLICTHLRSLWNIHII